MMNITTLIGSVGFALFFGLMVYSYRQGERRYVPGLVLVTLATLATLARGLFFPTARHIQPRLADPSDWQAGLWQ